MRAVWNWDVIKKWFYEMKVIKFTAGDFSEVYTIFYCVVDLFDLFESELYAM